MIIEREVLYKQVWSNPMIKVAKLYSVSSSYLARVCSQMEIPTPGRGYWAKVSNGYKAKLMPLKPLSKSGKDKMNTSGNTNSQKEKSKSTELLSILEQEDIKENRLVVPDKLTKPHKLISLTNISDSYLDNYGLQRFARGIPHLDIHVSKLHLKRSIRIMDTLIKALEQRGYKVEIIHDHRGYVTCANIFGQKLRFGIREHASRTSHNELDEKKKAGEKISDWEKVHYKDKILYKYHPTGKLFLIIDELIWVVKREWRENSNKTIENLLNDFIKGLIESSYIHKLKRDEQEIEWNKRKEIEEKHQAKLKRIEKLGIMADDWHRCQKIKQFIMAFEEQYKNTSPANEEMSQWLKWAKDYAETLNPITIRNIHNK